MDSNDKNYYLVHGEKGSTWSDHLYTARKWVNGKWQYIYGNVNNALGADERARRDNAYKGYQYNADAAKKANNKLSTAYEEYKNMNDRNNFYDNNGHEKRTRNPANAARSNALRKYENAYNNASQANRTKNLYEKAYKNAQADYDKTVYGKVDKAKAAIKSAANKVNNALGADERRDIDRAANEANEKRTGEYKARAAQAQSKYDKTFYGRVDKAKDIAKAAGKKTMASIGNAKDKAVSKGREVLASILNKRKSGKKG